MPVPSSDKEACKLHARLKIMVWGNKIEFHQHGCAAGSRSYPSMRSPVHGCFDRSEMGRGCTQIPADAQLITSLLNRRLPWRAHFGPAVYAVLPKRDFQGGALMADTAIGQKVSLCGEIGGFGRGVD
jgi:hypothetical protein